MEVRGRAAAGRFPADDGPLVIPFAQGGRLRRRQGLFAPVGNPHEEHGRIAQMGDAAVQVRQDLGHGAAEDGSQILCAQGLGDVRRDQQHAVAGSKGERRELGLPVVEAVHRLGVLVVGLVEGDRVLRGVEDARGSARGEHDAVAPARETTQPQAHAMLRDAPRVRFHQGALRLAEDGDERAREAQVERLPGALGLRDQVPGELVGGGCRPFRQREQLAALRPRPVPLGDADGGAALLGLVGDDRELADLERIVQGALPRCHTPRAGTGAQCARASPAWAQRSFYWRKLYGSEPSP